MGDTKDIVFADQFAQSKAILERAAAPADSTLPLPRLLLVFAHPDDEVLAMGGRLERLTASHLLTVTDGTPADGADALHHGFTSLEAYRAARQRELDAALTHAGLSMEIASPLEGTSLLPVPDQTASFHLTTLLHAIANAIRILAPEAVLTHPYEGGHPDHDACAFAVHTAVQWLGNSPDSNGTKPLTPVILEAPFYHVGPGGSIETGSFLQGGSSPATLVRALSGAEQARKQARLACFVSQAETLAQFGTARELFRIAPTYDFGGSPHPGQLFYEQFRWGMAGARFRELAAQARGEFLSDPANVFAEPTCASRP